MTQAVADRQHLNIEIIQHGATSWINIQQPGVAEMHYLKEHFNFHQLTLDDCLSVVQMPKLDQFEDHIFLVMHFPRFNKETRITQACEVDVFAGANYVITIHDGNLPPLMKLFKDSQGSQAIRESMMSQGSGYLLYRILDNLVDYCFPILNKVIDNVNQVEELVFESWNPDVIREMARLRHDILAYRRIVRPQIEVIEAMEARRFPFLRLNPDIYFGDLADHMRRIWSELEDLKEVIEGLYDSQGSLTTLRSNEIIRAMTGIATVLFPFLIVPGVYGMNIALPFEQQWWAFWFVMLVCGIMSFSLWALLKLGRWL